VNDPKNLSVWQFLQSVLSQRKQHADTFIYCDFQELDPKHPSMYANLRTSENGEKRIVVSNFSGEVGYIFGYLG